MKLLQWLILLVIFVCFLFAQDIEDDDDEEGECEDNFDWCPSQIYFCDTSSFIRRSCKETCGFCNFTSSACRTRGCEQICVSNDDDENAACVCEAGYILNSDERTCTDIDECSTIPNVCADPERAVCINTDGNYTCTTCRVLVDHTNYYRSNKCCRRNNRFWCGQNVVTGISGPSGSNYIIGLWPWTALISVNGKICTGVIISQDWILTSAHCFRFYTNAFPVSARVGIKSTNLNDSNVHSTEISISQITTHENYEFPYNDLALLRLNQSIVSSWAVRPVCMPNGEIPQENTRCWMAGFESIFTGIGVEQMLLDAEMTLLDPEYCTNNLGRIAEGVNMDNMLCGRYSSVRPSCPGETGGAIICQRCEFCDWYVAGMMTFGDACSAEIDSYVAYTSIESYEEWISTITGLQLNKNSSCSINTSIWRPWGAWSVCSETCGGGNQLRTRVCYNSNGGNTGCDGADADVQECGNRPCPRWSEFDNWSTCSTTCGQGTRNRNRFCLDGAIGEIGCHEGSHTETEICIETSCSYFGNWSSWSLCSPTCGSGRIRYSIRECINGNDCVGEDLRFEECTPVPCQPMYTEWSECSTTCGDGEERRMQICPSHENSCLEDEQVRPCNLGECPVPLYSPWSVCSVTCGIGQWSRLRLCAQNDIGCTSEIQTENCSLADCPLWSQWSDWTECNVTCGEGGSRRMRTCLTGMNCVGDPIEVMKCNTTSCPTEPPCLGDQKAWCQVIFPPLCDNSNTVREYCQARCNIC